MPTTDYLWTDADTVAMPSGDATVTSLAVFNGVATWEVARTFTGTACVVRLYVTSGSAMEVSIDGGSFGAVTVGVYDAFTDVTLWTGLPDVAHTFVLRATAGAPNSIAFNISAGGSYTFRVTGAAPSSAFPAGYGHQVYLKGAEWAAYGKDDGEWASSSNPNYRFTQWADDGVRFVAAPTAVYAFAYGSGNKIRVTIDGADGPIVTLPNDSKLARRLIASGLSGTHEYALVNASGLLLVNTVELVGGSALSVAPATLPTFGVLGDSISRGSLGTGDSTLSFAHRVAGTKGWTVLNRAYDGATGHDFGTGADPVTTYSGERSTHLARVTGYTPKPKRVVWAYGFNDLAVGTVSTGQWQATVTAAMNLLTNALDSDALVIVVGVWPNTSGYTLADSAPERAAWNAYTLAGIAACDHPGHVVFDDPDTWGDYVGSAPQTSDGLHPNVTGEGLIVPHILTDVSDAPESDPPVFASAAVPANGLSVVVQFTEAASPPLLPSSGVTGFTMTAAGRALRVTGTTRTADTELTIALASAVYAREDVAVTYAGGNVADSANNALADFGPSAATNNSIVPSGVTYADPADVRSGVDRGDGVLGTLTALAGTDPPAAPAFARSAGAAPTATRYRRRFRVEIFAEDGADVYWAANGRGPYPPTLANPYLGPFDVFHDTTITAVAVRDGLASPFAAVRLVRLDRPVG